MKRVALKINRLNLFWSLIFLCFNLTGIGFLHAETHILNSTTMIVTPGTTITNMDNLLLDNGGVLNNQGTMVIKGNLQNNNTSQSNLGTGTFIFSGTSAQTISGHNIFKHLTINNSAGVAILNNDSITDTLELTSGLLKLRKSNLTLYASAKVTGTFSGTTMIASDSSGQLRKLFTSTGSFLFPVGDTTGNYTPVRLNFTGGTFGAGAYAGITLRKRKYNDPNLTTDYLKRYWTITTNNITGSISCNANFHYVQADVQGTEANLYCLRMSPLTTFSPTSVTGDSLTANGFTSMGTFTGGHGAVNSNLTAYLQGPYNTGTHAMNTTLRTAGPVPVNQPYTGAPWSYGGTEHVSPIPANVVDWVLVELRQSDTIQNAKTTGPRRAAFLMSNGSIVDTDGVSPVRFYNLTVTQKLYPVIWHRNHMPVIAAHSVPINGSGTYLYDFSSGSGQVYGGTNGTKQIDASPVRWGMVAGDANSNG